ncbi:MAG TPA: DUF6788 family protein [Candidatus Thermoplasmatota archaeon]|nr:DUF6788 family protein [Candidatus Thermoplasmatota archaeon]
MDGALERVKAVLARLPREDLSALRTFLDGILLTPEEAAALADVTVAAARAKTGERVVYRREWVRCGKKGCRCRDSAAARHGPYLYKYWWEKGRTRKAYVGRDGATPHARRDASGEVRAAGAVSSRRPAARSSAPNLDDPPGNEAPSPPPGP